MLCEPDCFDLSTYAGQVAHIKAVRRRITSGRFVKGGTVPPSSAPHLALGTQNQGEGTPLVVDGEPEADVKGSTANASLSGFFDAPSVAVAYSPRPFDLASFRTNPLEGEDLPGARVPFPHLCRLICAEVDLNGAELWSDHRGGLRVFARHAVWWLAKRWTTLSYPKIGRLSVLPAVRSAVGRDHSTVIHGVQRLEAWRAGGPGYYGIPTYAEWLDRRTP